MLGVDVILSLIMSSYQQFTELTMTDTARGFSNPAYNETNPETAAVMPAMDSSPSSDHVHVKVANGKTVSRSNSIGEDPDHIEVSKTL